MRINSNILFVSLITLLGVATIYTLSRSQSSETLLQSSNDYPLCVQLGGKCFGGFNVKCKFAIANTCDQPLQFTITYISLKKIDSDIYTTGCLRNQEYEFFGQDNTITQITQQTCSLNN